MNDSVTTIQTWIAPVKTSAGQDERHRHLDDLRRQHHVPPIAAIGDDAADQREEQDRHFAGEAVEAEIERGRRPGHRDDQPRLRHLLHPRADARRERAEPQQPEIAVGEGDRDAGRGLIDSIAQRDSILCDISPHEEYPPSPRLRRTSRSDPPPLHGDVRGSRPGLDAGARRPRGRACRTPARQKVTLAMVNEALKLSGIEVTEDEKTGIVEGANRNLDRLRAICGSSTSRPTCRRRSTSAR